MLYGQNHPVYPPNTCLVTYTETNEAMNFNYRAVFGVLFIDFPT